MSAPADAEAALVEALFQMTKASVALVTRSLEGTGADLSLPQFRALVVLSDEGPLPTTVLAGHMGVHQSTATRTSQRLVPMGLVSREPGERDRRVTMVSLTPRGVELVAEVMRRRRVAIAESVAQMGELDAPALTVGLTRFAAVVLSGPPAGD